MPPDNCGINQVSAAVLTGPGGPHRRASVGLDTTPCFRYRGARAPDRHVFALPAERTSTSSSIARCRPRGPAAPMPGTTSFDCVNSAFCRYETSRRPRTARVRLPMATSAVTTSAAAGASVSAGREGGVAPPPPVRAHTLVSLSSTGTRPSCVMQAISNEQNRELGKLG